LYFPPLENTLTRSLFPGVERRPRRQDAAGTDVAAIQAIACHNAQALFHLPN